MFESFFDFMSNLDKEIQQMKAEGYPEELIHDHIQDSRKDYNYRKSVSDAINRRESEARYYNGLDPDNPYDDL